MNNPKMFRLCNHDCNNCEAIDNPQIAALYGNPPSNDEGLKPAAATDSIKTAPNTQPLTPKNPVSDPATTAERPDSAGSPTH